MSFPPAADWTPDPALRAVLSGLLDFDVATLHPVGGGRNSRVLRAADRNGTPYIVKIYFRHDGDTRDRLTTEFQALTFLREHGVCNVPRPLAMSADHGCLLLECVEGRTIDRTSVGRIDVEAAADFLVRLKALSVCPAAGRLGEASEACFSIGAILGNLRQRLDRFTSFEPHSSADESLREFLQHDLLPGLDTLEGWCRRRAVASDVAFDDDVDQLARTLSPSDFGFHNALRRPAGDLVFLDFEYFGWDDPAKMAADVILHPAMELEPTLKRVFIRRLLTSFGEGTGLARRLEVVYPLFGLKWCVILLNEFLPAVWRRRRFAGRASSEVEAAKLEQLVKARRMWATIEGQYESFPYFD